MSNGYRSWTRGCETSNDTCGLAKNLVFPLNSTPYNGSNNFNNSSYGSNHSSGAFFLYCDATVHFIDQSIGMPVLLSLASRNGNETVAPPE
jgi:hypothetical protein